MPDDDLAAVSLRALREPRPLTAEERALLDALVEPFDLPELSAAAAAAQVSAECACGCPSIGLWAEDGVKLSAATLTQLPAVSPGVIEITAYGVNPRGDDVQVTLHAADVGLLELEVYAGHVRTELPAPGTLRPQPRG